MNIRIFIYIAYYVYNVLQYSYIKYVIKTDIIYLYDIQNQPSQ